MIETAAKVLGASGDLAEHIGDAQVRNCGTIGGSIANNDPAADYPAAVVGLNATIKTTKREIGALVSSLVPGAWAYMRLCSRAARSHLNRRATTRPHPSCAPRCPGCPRPMLPTRRPRAPR